MRAGRLDSNRTRSRDRIEAAQIELVALLVDLDEVILRNSQAIQRTGLVADVLEPSLERLHEIRSSLRLVKQQLDDHWAEQQAQRWSPSHDDD